MKSRPDLTLEVRLSAPSLDVCVDVSLRSVGERWVGVAAVAGRREVGVGTSARQALTASLAPLGDRVRTALLADPALLVTSRAVAARTGG